MIDSAIGGAIRFFNFITSDTGVQWVYLALAVIHLLLGFDRMFEHWLTKKGVTIEPPRPWLIASDWLCTVVFILSVLINGANPRLSRAVIMPYSRFIWFLVAVLLAVCVVLKSWRLLSVALGKQVVLPEVTQ